MPRYFSKSDERLARNMSNAELQREYAKSEAKLKYAARRGNEKTFLREMKRHQTYEYAMLYKEFLRNQKKKGRC